MAQRLFSEQKHVTQSLSWPLQELRGVHLREGARSQAAAVGADLRVHVPVLREDPPLHPDPHEDSKMIFNPIPWHFHVSLPCNKPLTSRLFKLQGLQILFNVILIYNYLSCNKTFNT